jgi:hypothetical protein
MSLDDAHIPTSVSVYAVQWPANVRKLLSSHLTRYAVHVIFILDLEHIAIVLGEVTQS